MPFGPRVAPPKGGPQSGPDRLWVDEVVVVIGWPDSGLSPNARCHWARKAKLKAHYRAASAARTPAVRVQRGALRLEVLFRPVPRRMADMDNMLASIKAGIDGVCDTLQLNDARFRVVELSCDPAPKRDPEGGHVVLRISSLIADLLR